MAGAYQDKISRVRKPRVHITYEVETNGAMEIKELPFVVGVMAALSGHRPEGELGPLKDRKFTQIDRDNFDDVMAKVSPELHFKAENTLAGDKSEMQVDLKFQSMEDFSPARVADQVPALKKLLETRARLSDLVSKVDRSENLEAVLEKILKNEEELKKLSHELGLDKKEGS